MRIAPICDTKPDLKIKPIITWAAKEVSLEDYSPPTQTQTHTRVCAQAQLFLLIIVFCVYLISPYFPNISCSLVENNDNSELLQLMQ